MTQYSYIYKPLEWFSPASLSSDVSYINSPYIKPPDDRHFFQTFWYKLMRELDITGLILMKNCVSWNEFSHFGVFSEIYTWIYKEDVLILFYVVF
jgi:hypothetical protein